jgi:hypothetical protein
VTGKPQLWPLNSLQPLSFDPVRCRAELDELDALLALHASLDEQKQILPFFRTHPQITALLGSYCGKIRTFDRLAFELDLFGDFKADAVVGDTRRESFCFIEFEDGRPESIFRRVGKRRTLEWSSRFDHGASQIIDWCWKLDDFQRTDGFIRLFGSPTIEISGLLVVGRDTGVSQSDYPRLQWRRKYVTVNAQPLYCCTFDELARDLRDTLDTYTAVASVS